MDRSFSSLEESEADSTGESTDNLQPPSSDNISNSASFGLQSSGKALEWGFDFVEEFDGLQDWTQSSLGRVGNQFEDTELERMPKLANGDRSAWGYFSQWESEASSHLWIGGTEGGRKVWRGTKSVAIDLGGTGHGPSRLGLHFGRSGYKDLSVFYMVYMPKNNFPTAIACTKWNESNPQECDTNKGGVGTYAEGAPYAYWAAYKFNTFDLGCSDIRCPGPRGPAYGVHTAVGSIKQYNYSPNGVLFANSNYGPEHSYAKDAGTTLNSYFGQWFGVEYRIRNNETSTGYTMDMWIYDQNGNSSHIMQGHYFPIVPEGYGGSWDRFFFGGNNSNSWIWGPTMTSHYYIDDFIIDEGKKGRIGPRYFSKILN